MSTRMWALTLLGASFAAWTLAGCCMPYSQLRDARTVGEGNSRIGMGMSFMKPGANATAETESEDVEASTDDLDDIPGWPLLGLDFAYGITDRFDIGVRVSTAGALVDGKVSLFENEHLALAVDPAVGWGFFLISSGPRVDLPVLFSVGGKTISLYGGASYSMHWLGGELFGLEDLRANALTGFGGLSFEFRSVYFKLEYAYSDVRTSSEEGNVHFALHQPALIVGVKWGEQINELEKRMDRLERKVDGPGAAPPAPLTPPAPARQPAPATQPPPTTPPAAAPAPTGAGAV